MLRSYKRSQREFKFEINIVPLLDVLLVLLVVLMTTAPVITQSVVVDLPGKIVSTKSINTNDSPTIIIEVSDIGKYSLVIEKNRMDQLPDNQVIFEVQQCLQANPKSIFLIGGKKDLPYEEIIKAINLLHSAGVKSVGLMTQPI